MVLGAFWSIFLQCNVEEPGTPNVNCFCCFFTVMRFLAHILTTIERKECLSVRFGRFLCKSVLKSLKHNFEAFSLILHCIACFVTHIDQKQGKRVVLGTFSSSSLQFSVEEPGTPNVNCFHSFFTVFRVLAHILTTIEQSEWLSARFGRVLCNSVLKSLEHQM